MIAQKGLSPVGELITVASWLGGFVVCNLGELVALIPKKWRMALNIENYFNVEFNLNQYNLYKKNYLCCQSNFIQSLFGNIIVVAIFGMCNL